MNLKNFRLNILIRVLLLAGLSLLLAFVWIGTDFIVVTFLCGVMVLLATLELIAYLERSHRDLSGFLASIKHDDYSMTFTTSQRGRSFDRLYLELNQITDQFQQIRAEKEMQYQYLQTIVEHVEVGLLCYDQASGEVLLMNKALQRMLRRPYVQHINGFRYLGDTFNGVLNRIKPGERELVKLRTENELLQLAVRATEFKLQQDPFLLVSFQNIRGELEARDLEAWQQLIRILTHEIMNSVTPVVSLTGTLQEMFDDEEALEDPELLTDAREGLSAIKNRGLGLIRFTEAYRDLTRLPEPEIEEVSAKELIHRVLTLFKPKFAQEEVECQVHESSQDLRLQVDPQLIEQVLINLLKNAIEALEDVTDPLISVSYGRDGSRVMMAIQDNGPGISEEVLDRIFVPFYTTKSSGSGIGLSLSRQIMQKHKGSLSVNSSLGKGTTFILTL